jgi:hypothetical protein
VATHGNEGHHDHDGKDFHVQDLCLKAKIEDDELDEAPAGDEGPREGG